MANFIEELFYNNINPQARMFRNRSNLQKQLGLLSDYEEQLTSTLKDDERKSRSRRSELWRQRLHTRSREIIYCPV